MTKVTDILDDLEELAGDESEVSIDDVKQKIGHRGAGVFLLVPGLIGMSPIGAIPSVPTIMGVITIIFAVQILAGKTPPWLPKMLSERAVDDDRLAKAVEKSRGFGKWLDRWFGGRLTFLTGDPMIRIAAIGAATLALTAPFLEVVPFAALIPMAGIALFGLAVTLRDGLAMLIALLYAAGALYAAFMLIP